MKAFIWSVISNVEVKLSLPFCAVEGLEEEERLDIESVEELLMVVVEGEPDAELIVGLVMMVVKNTIITYNNGLLSMIKSI